MRPRLVLRLEQQIQKNINDPSFVYEALKVYLMLGGKAPAVDKDLILDWFAPRLGREHVSRRALCAGARIAARTSRRDARSRRQRDAEDFAERPAGRAGAGDAGAHARLRARLYAVEVRGSYREARGLDRLAPRRPGYGAGLRSGERGQSRHRPRPRVLHLSGLLSRASRPHDDDRRQDAEGAMGARRVGRARRRQAAICEHDAGYYRSLRQGDSSTRGMSRSAIWRCVRWSPTSRNISLSARPRRRRRRSSRYSNRSATKRR